jgi:hypothetical protein
MNPTQTRIDRLLAISRACVPGSLAAARLEELAIALKKIARMEMWRAEKEAAGDPT